MHEHLARSNPGTRSPTDRPESVCVRLPDEPESPARARDLARRLDGSARARVDDVRLLLHELVAAALFEGVEFVDVRVVAREECLALEVVAPVDPADARNGVRRPRANGGVIRRVIRDLSDRCGRDGARLWCELDGAWALQPEGRG